MLENVLQINHINHIKLIEHFILYKRMEPFFFFLFYEQGKLNVKIDGVIIFFLLILMDKMNSM